MILSTSGQAVDTLEVTYKPRDQTRLLKISRSESFQVGTSDSRILKIFYELIEPSEENQHDNLRSL